MALTVSELVEQMQSAFSTEWQAAKGGAAPEAGADDRRLMFAAISRGLLEYLESHENDFMTSITFEDASGDATTRRVRAVALDLDTEG